MPKDECNELKTIQYKTMLLNHKEIKEDIKCDSSTNIEDFLNKESQMHKVEPWNKLDKTTKVKKLEKYYYQRIQTFPLIPSYCLCLLLDLR